MTAVLKEWPPPYRVVRSTDDAARALRWMSTRKPVLAFDTESAGLNWWRDEMRLLQLSDGHTHTWVIPTRFAGPVLEKLPAYLQARTKHGRHMAAANLKYDRHVLRTAGADLPWDGVDDIQMMASALFPGEPKDLKSIGVKHFDPMGAILDKWLGRIFVDNGWAKESGAKKPLGWAMIPDDNEVYLAYAAWDAWATAQAYTTWAPRMTGEVQDVYTLDHRATKVLAGMEQRGTRIDRAYCHVKAEDQATFIAAARESIELRYGIDPGKNQEVGRYLEAAGEVLPNTETGQPSVAAEVLEVLDHPLAAELLEVRHAERYLNYFQGMLENAGDGEIMHPSINPLGARTGRMSISEPPLHQLPRLALIRDAVIPRDGNVLAKSDFDQIEMRLLAHFLLTAEGDPTMADAIAEGDRRAAAGESGYDLHSMNARAIYGLSMDAKVPNTKRTLAKNGGFAKVYGAGGKRFALTVNKGLPPEEHITEAEGKAFIERLEATFPGLRPFTQHVEHAAKARERKGEDPWIKAPSGRRHVAKPGKCLSHGKAGCPMSCRGRDRLYFQLPNYLIQGTAADVFKAGLVRMDERGLADRLILPVHDEAIADVPRDEAQDYVVAMADALQDHTSFEVALTADGALVERWGEGYD